MPCPRIGGAGRREPILLRVAARNRYFIFPAGEHLHFLYYFSFRNFQRISVLRLTRGPINHFMEHVATASKEKIFNATVLVAALGYFVDIYDLQLFNLVSKQSLGPLGLNLSQELIDRYDYLLFLWQMGGMLVGGLLWGILGDKLGRKSVLFGSILIYSLANIANGFVTDLNMYVLVRFIAGFGLAGELGAAITLVSEILHRESRGWGTMIVVTVGALGAVVANIIARTTTWQVSYFIGGGLGLMLLLLRVGTFESKMFDSVKHSEVQKGNFFMLFTDRKRFLKYLCCILVGLPVWYTIGILVKFADKFAAHSGVTGEAIKVGNAIMYAYIGLSVGDLFSGWLSQIWRSRRKTVFFFLGLTVVLVFLYLYLHNLSSGAFYFLIFMLGAATGFWALFVTIAAEQFGTNIRATVTTTAPNFVRGAVIPLVLGFQALQQHYDLVTATLIMGAISVGLSALATWYLKETFGKDLQYTE